MTDVLKTPPTVNLKIKVVAVIKNILNVCLGFLIILFFLSLANLLVEYYASQFPPAILAMLMLFTALSLGIIKLSWVELTGNIVLKYLALLFIPVGVGLINYLDLILMHWLAIVFSLFFTTLLTLFLVGHCYQFLAKKGG